MNPPEGYSLMTVELFVNGKIIALGGEPVMARAMAARVAELTQQAPPDDGCVVKVDCSREKAVEITRRLKVEFPDAMGTPIDQRVHDLEVPQH